MNSQLFIVFATIVFGVCLAKYLIVNAKAQPKASSTSTTEKSQQKVVYSSQIDTSQTITTSGNNSSHSNSSATRSRESHSSISLTDKSNHTIDTEKEL